MVAVRLSCGSITVADSEHPTLMRNLYLLYINSVTVVEGQARCLTLTEDSMQEM